MQTMGVQDEHGCRRVSIATPKEQRVQSLMSMKAYNGIHS